MKEKLNITSIERIDNVKTKYGDKSKWININGNQSASAFISDWNKDWKVGDEVEVDIKNNGQYINYNCPEDQKPKSPMADKVDAIDGKLDKILEIINKQ